MNFILNFPLFLIVLSLVTAVLCTVLPDKAVKYFGLGLPILSVAANITIFFYCYRTNTIVNYMMGHYPHPWGNEIRISPSEPIISTVFSGVLFLCLFGGKKQIKDKVDPLRLRYYFSLTSLIQAALLVLVYTNDIFTGYVFIEICTLSSCGILMIRRNGKTTLASIRYMIFSLIGSGLFLFGVVILYNITGELLMPDLKAKISAIWYGSGARLPLLTAICLIVMGIAIKSGCFPFHHWMPDTYGAAIPASSGILSGLISKGYIVFLIKIICDVFGTDVFYASGVQNVLYTLGAIGIVVGSFGAIQENNILRMIAYSSAAQIGYIYMGIGLSPKLGLEAAIFHVLVHAITKPALFLSAGLLTDARGGAKKFRNLQGVGFENPVAGAVFTFEAFSMIGIPLTMGFISKYLFGAAAFDSAHLKMIPTLLVLAVSTILNTLYFARTVIRIYDKFEYAGVGKQKKLRPEWAYILAASVFVAVNLMMGIFAKSFIDVLGNSLNIF